MAARDHPALPRTCGPRTLPIGCACRLRSAPSGAGRVKRAREQKPRPKCRCTSREMVARETPQQHTPAARTIRRQACAGVHGGDRYRASGRRAPSSAAVGNAAARFALSRIAPHVRIRREGRAGGRGTGHSEHHDRQTPRAQDAVAALDRTAGVFPGADFIARRRRRQCWERRQRPSGRLPRGVLSPQASRQTQTAASTSCAFRSAGRSMGQRRHQKLVFEPVNRQPFITGYIQTALESYPPTRAA